MPPIEELKKHLFNEDFRHVLDEHGKPVPPKSYVYKEISILMNNALSPKYMYSILLTNRYGVHEALLTHYDIQKPNNITASSIDDDESFNQSIPNTEIDCLVKIPLKVWHDIDCEKVIYKSRLKVQRNYSTLRRGRWTNEVFALIYQETKLPCAFTFKRCTISEIGIYITINASCPDCKATMIATVANKPPSDAIHVRLECRINGFNPSIKHIKKRPLNGVKRAEISESLATGAQSAATWRRKVADDLMELYDDEPPHIYNAATLRKAKQEKRDKNLKVKGTCAISSLQNMKYTDYAGSIHGVGCDPFFIHYWTSEQIAVYINYHDVLYIDATGSLVKKLLLPNGEQSPHIYLYQAVAGTPTHKMPVFQMLSASQNVNAIQYWMSEFLRVGEKHKSGFPLPRTIVCDFDKGLLNAIAKVFGQSANLKNYLSTCYAALLNEPGIKMPKCFIRLDVCHYMHFLSRWKCFSQLHPKVKKFYLYAMALLTKQTIFIEFVDLVKHIVILSLSEDVGKNGQGLEVPAQSARTAITGKIKGISDVDKSVDELENKNDCIEQDISLDDCNVVAWADSIVDECRRTVKFSEAGDEINPYYVPELGNKLKNLLYYFPLFTGIMIPVFGYGNVNISSATVESEMKDVKHVLLKNDARPMRADKFVATHLRSFSGRAKLALASQEWAAEESSKLNSPCSITNSPKTSIDENTANYESVIIPNVVGSPAGNFGIDEQVRDVVTIPEIEINNSPIDKNLEMCSSTSDTELNIEHNWRNKNTCSTRRKTYLDTCPDWDATGFSRNRVGIGNLENSNTCPLISQKEMKIVVCNTCGFDSIISILAGACVRDTYRYEVSLCTSDTMRFLLNFLEQGCCATIYRDRALLLRKVDHFRTKFENNVLTVDCYASVGNIAQYILANDPSYEEKKLCHICATEGTRTSIIVPINVDVVKEHGVGFLSDAIVNGMPSRKPVCCDRPMEVNLVYGSQIVIEYDPSACGKHARCRLLEFPKSIHLAGRLFALAGVIARYGGSGRRQGHYVGYSYQGTRWMEFDDTVKKAKVKTDQFSIEPHLILYALA